MKFSLNRSLKYSAKQEVSQNISIVALKFRTRGSLPQAAHVSGAVSALNLPLKIRSTSPP